MSEYSEDFSDNQHEDFDEDSKDDEISYNKHTAKVLSSRTGSADSHKEQFEKNLEALREEIKALEFEQLQNLETFDSGETLELADDSSEDDMSYVKKRQTSIKNKAPNKPQPSAKAKKNSAIVYSLEKDSVSKNHSFNSKLVKKQRVYKKDINDVAIFHARPKQIVSAVPDIRGIKSRKRVIKHSEGNNMKVTSVIESFERNPTIRGPDWKKSVLESFVNSGLFEFNWEKDPEIMSEEQIFQSSRNVSGKVIRDTFKRLAKELFYEEKVNLNTLKVDVQRLMMARKNVVNVLRDIHDREDLLIAVLTLGKDAGSELGQMQKRLAKLTKEVQINIQKLKDSILGIENFVYFGEDYQRKIKDDEKRITRIIGVAN